MTVIGKGLTFTIQRNLAAAGESVSTALERLSSGQRLNRASDDASGRSIADSLNVKSRVHSQGIRNVSDGISALNIADSALGTLSAVTTRLKELAVQASSGSLSLSQRRSLNSESTQLIDEFNRIISTTQFNNIQLLDATTSDVRIQDGFGVNGGVTFGLAREIRRTVGDGTFGTGGLYSLTGSTRTLEADLDQDGDLDIVSQYGGGFQILAGNGSGGFSSLGGIATTPGEFALGDVNGDGSTDVIKVGTNQVTYFLNNGSGTFGAGQNLALSAGTYSGVGVADVNGDGIPDVIGSNSTSGTISVRLGSGGGSFAAAIDYGGATAGGRITIGDANGDGVLDILAIGTSGVNVFAGGSGGTFSTASFYATGANAVEAQIYDFNSDGLTDIAVYNQTAGTLSILSGLGNSIFGQKVDISVPTTPAYGTLRLGDFDGDGRADLGVGAAIGNYLNIYRNNGDGSFSLYKSQFFNNGPSGAFSIGDYNGDGALDFGYAGYGSQFIRHLQGTKNVSTIQNLNLASRYSALEALGALDTILSKISLERASIGASQSRLNVAYQGLAANTLVSKEAAARITDADTATEVAGLVRAQILQNIGTSLLAQANQSASLMLNLLKFDAA